MSDKFPKCQVTLLRYWRTYDDSWSFMEMCHHTRPHYSQHELKTVTRYNQLICRKSHRYCTFVVFSITLRIKSWVMSRDATLVVIPCTKFELDTTYRSRVRTTTIFHWPPAWSLNFYVLGVRKIKFEIWPPYLPKRKNWDSVPGGPINFILGGWHYDDPQQVQHWLPSNAATKSAFYDA